jgi:hypothetical protein
MAGNSQTTMHETDDLRPNLDTLRILDSDGQRLRIFLTLGGNLVCERFNPTSSLWSFVPLKRATEEEVNVMIAVRESSQDEEMAREIAGHSS